MFLPVLGPGTAVIIDETRISRSQLGRPAVGVLDIAQALDDAVASVWIIRSRPSGKTIAGSHRHYEGVGIVEDRLVIQTDELAIGVTSRFPGFHSLHLVAVFEHGMREGPTLDICRVRDQRGSVPESDRLPKPLRRPLNMGFLPDHGLTQE